MGLGRRANLLCAAMVAGGVALGGYVWASWPEPETRVVRLPYGEALPKRVEAPVAARVAAPAVVEVGAVAGAVAKAAPEAPEEPVRVVASVEPVTSGAPVYLAPKPVASPNEDDYFETAEELGAEPLPGAEGAPAEPAPDGDEDDAPVVGAVIELPLPGAG